MLGRVPGGQDAFLSAKIERSEAYDVTDALFRVTFWEVECILWHVSTPVAGGEKPGGFVVGSVGSCRPHRPCRPDHFDGVTRSKRVSRSDNVSRISNRRPADLPGLDSSVDLGN